MSYTFFKKVTSALFAGGVLILGLSASPAQALVDSTSPVVATVTPLTATAGQSVTVNSSFTEEGSGINYCYLIVNGVGLSSDMTRSGSAYAGTLSQVHTFATAGSYTAAVRCYDMSGNIGQSTDATIVVSAAVPTDSTPPTVNMPAVANVSVGASVTFSATYSDASTVSSCGMYLNGVLEGTMAGTGSSGSVSYTRVFSSAGTYPYHISCTDTYGNIGLSLTRTLTVSPISVDGVAPVLGVLSPSSAVVGSPVTFSATYADSVGVTTCEFDPGTAVTYSALLSGSITSGTASRSYTFASPGVRTVYMRCSDASGNVGTVSQSVNVVNSVVSGGDSVFPSFIGSITPTNVSVNTVNTYSIEYVDNVGVTRCDVYADYILVGYAGLSGTVSGRASWSQSFGTAGTHLMRFECQDAAGNRSGTPNISVNVSAPSADTIPPTVGPVSPVSAVANVQTTLSTYVNDNQTGVGRCELFVNGVTYGTMDIVGGGVSRPHVFPSAGTYSTYARCWDLAGNSTNGPVTSVTVSWASNNGTPGVATVGSLMKSMCPGYYVASDHPCRAVYYFGRDGRRHAFPNANVYFTWYSDFSSVVEVSDAFLASIPLGRNVTYRPGIRLVKFTTVNRVYAVGVGGVLRWVTTEELARQLYGNNWATRVDDIADVFYTNYVFGADITATYQYNPANEASVANTIDQNVLPVI